MVADNNNENWAEVINKFITEDPDIFFESDNLQDATKQSKKTFKFGARLRPAKIITKYPPSKHCGEPYVDPESGRKHNVIIADHVRVVENRTRNASDGNAMSMEPVIFIGIKPSGGHKVSQVRYGSKNLPDFYGMPNLTAIADDERQKKAPYVSRKFETILTIRPISIHKIEWL